MFGIRLQEKSKINLPKGICRGQKAVRNLSESQLDTDPITAAGKGSGPKDHLDCSLRSPLCARALLGPAQSLERKEDFSLPSASVQDALEANRPAAGCSHILLHHCRRRENRSWRRLFLQRARGYSRCRRL